MRVGTSLTLFTIGAILGLAVHANLSVINFNLIGLILMLVAILGFALSPGILGTHRRVIAPARATGADARARADEVPEQPIDSIVRQSSRTYPNRSIGLDPAAQRSQVPSTESSTDASGLHVKARRTA